MSFDKFGAVSNNSAMDNFDSQPAGFKSKITLFVRYQFIYFSKNMKDERTTSIVFFYDYLGNRYAIVNAKNRSAKLNS